MSGSNCCFLTCIQISQEASQVACYSHLFKNFPQFVVIHTIKGFPIVSVQEVFAEGMNEQMQNSIPSGEPFLMRTRQVGEASVSGGR